MEGSSIDCIKNPEQPTPITSSSIHNGDAEGPSSGSAHTGEQLFEDPMKRESGMSISQNEPGSDSSNYHCTSEMANIVDDDNSPTSLLPSKQLKRPVSSQSEEHDESKLPSDAPEQSPSTPPATPEPSQIELHDVVKPGDDPTQTHIIPSLTLEPFHPEMHDVAKQPGPSPTPSLSSPSPTSDLSQIKKYDTVKQLAKQLSDISKLSISSLEPSQSRRHDADKQPIGTPILSPSLNTNPPQIEKYDIVKLAKQLGDISKRPLSSFIPLPTPKPSKTERHDAAKQPIDIPTQPSSLPSPIPEASNTERHDAAKEPIDTPSQSSSIPSPTPEKSMTEGNDAAKKPNDIPTQPSSLPSRIPKASKTERHNAAKQPIATPTQSSSIPLPIPDASKTEQHDAATKPIATPTQPSSLPSPIPEASKTKRHDAAKQPIDTPTPTPSPSSSIPPPTPEQCNTEGNDGPTPPITTMTLPKNMNIVFLQPEHVQDNNFEKNIEALVNKLRRKK